MPKFETIGKSKQFFDFLKNEILSGEYKTGDKFPSIRELASKYGISSITVNSVISNLVTEGLLYVEQGRGTFVADRKQNSRKKKMIGVMFFDFSMENNVEAGMFNGIQKNLKDDYFVIPYNSYNKLDLFYKGIKGLMELEVDAMILVPPTSEDYDAQTVKKIINRDLPVVFINRYIPSIEADFFTMDFEAGTYKAARHLIDRNRRNIAMLASDSASLTERMCRGYKKALEEAGIEYDKKLILEWHTSMDRARKELELLLPGIDGLIGSDFVIYKLRKALEQVNKKIPGELSIVSLNDTVYSRFMEPPLTSVPFPSEKIGTEAVKAVIKNLEEGPTEKQHREFETEIIVRGSS